MRAARMTSTTRELQPVEVKVDVIEPTGPDTLVFAQVNGKRDREPRAPGVESAAAYEYDAVVRCVEGGVVRSGQRRADRLSEQIRPRG